MPSLCAPFAAFLLFFSLASLPASTGFAAGTGEPFAKWENEIAAFEKADQLRAPEKGGIVFVGSSSIRLWKTLAQDLPEYRTLNRGFGGSQVADSVHFADRIIFPYEPSMVVLYAGGNDINSGKSAERVFDDLKTFLTTVRERLPNATIGYISVAGNPARWSQIEKIRTLNQLAREYIEKQPRMKFIDVHSRMLGADGLPLPGIFVDDKLHMNAEGYKIWTATVRPYLAEAREKETAKE
ncbi:MAG: SGNH/GDSL hydrolase family protein [Verrucomicrobiota bacterium]